MQSIKRDQYLLLGVFLLVYLLPLGARPLIVPDETRYAEIPREMIADGEWAVPHLDGLRYFEKPALGYWVHAAAIVVFGENNFAVRLPSALAVGLTAILIFQLVGRADNQRRRPDHRIAALATLIFLTSFEVFGVGNTAVLDNLFALFLTAAVIAFYTATERPPGTAGEKGWLLLAGAASGLAFLTKGFLGVALPVLVFAPYLAWQGRSRDIWRLGWLPVLAAVLVALPWGVAIALREPDFWHFFFWNEHIRRFMASDAQHSQPFWYFFMLAPAMFMPWTFLVPVAAAGLGGSSRTGKPLRQPIRLCLCWLVLPFVFFSISKGKLLTYILPCFPPYCILLAIGLAHAIRKGKGKPIQWGIAGVAILFTLVLSGFIAIQVFGYRGFRPFGQPWKAVMVASGLLSMVLFCFWALKSRLDVKKMVLLGLSPLFLFFFAHFALPDQTIVSKAPGRFLERYRSSIGRDSVVICDEESVRAACWYLKRSDLYVLGAAGELDYGIAYPDATGRSLPLDMLGDFIARYRGKLVLIARSENIQRWRGRLPKPVSMNTSGSGGYSLWNY